MWRFIHDGSKLKTFQSSTHSKIYFKILIGYYIAENRICHSREKEKNAGTYNYTKIIKNIMLIEIGLKMYLLHDSVYMKFRNRIKLIYGNWV